MTRSSRLDGDRGDIVLGWLTKLTVVLGVVGVLGFDAISLGTTTFTAEDHAQTAARAAADAFASGKDLQKAYDAALAAVVADGDTIEAPTFAVAPDGAVTLTLHRTASTLLIEKVSPISDWADMSATVTAHKSV